MSEEAAFPEDKNGSFFSAAIPRQSFSSILKR